MTSPAVPQSTRLPAEPFLDQLFGAFWPEHALAARPRHVLAALGAGLLAAVVLPFRDAGVGTFMVLMAVGGVVASAWVVALATAERRLATPYHLGALALCTLLVATVFLRDAEWIVALCVMAAVAVAVATLTEGRSLPALLASGLAVPLAALRGLPWLGRSVTASRTSRSWAPALRTVAVSAFLVLVFGLLFASADALFASWAGAVVPDVTGSTFVMRTILTAVVAGATLAGVYVALNPPQVERAAPPAGRPVARPFEWLVPVGAVVVLFGVFVAAQLTVMFGGHDYLRRTTGLTYAEYVHQGFGQLTFATLLTLGVVAAAARKAPRGTPRERLLLRVVLGLLCLLTLVVVASALYRMHVYEQAYGFTRLRLLVSVFEGWLGLVVLFVLAAGLRLRGPWVPRAALLSGAVSLLALALANPDAWIAQHNVDRFEETGKVDTSYLAALSDDAVPVLAGAGFSAACLGSSTAPADDDWLEWNLGRQRAADAARTSDGSSCPAAPSAG